jgi:tRNA dimethylallyltransferase
MAATQDIDLTPILIAGATASGKSKLALDLAHTHGGCIINADSMQVYRDLRILTARPSLEDEAAVPHLLYGHVPAAEPYSVGRYVTDAARAIACVQARGLRPILTGGTGLYFKALLEGLSPIPSIPEDVRAHWRTQAGTAGPAALHGLLAQRDPVMADRLEPSDTQRVVRALEVLEATGRSLSDWQLKPGTPVIAADAIKLLVSRPRAELHARADARFDAMVEAGALEEAAALDALRLDPALPAMRALGVAPLIAAARGQIALEEAVAQAKAETRKYIKRQETWFRKYMISWNISSAQ